MESEINKIFKTVNIFILFDEIIFSRVWVVD